MNLTISTCVSTFPPPLKKIDLKSVFTDEVFVYADKHMIDTVIRNLASNALKFTSYNGSVTIGMQKPVITNLNGAEKSDSFVKVFVTDTGVGISNEDTTKLFRVDVQHSTTGTDDEAGIGLGLIMCKDMVEKMKGKFG